MIFLPTDTLTNLRAEAEKARAFGSKGFTVAPEIFIHILDRMEDAEDHADQLEADLEQAGCENCAGK
jgi:hypothetical protein